MFDIEFIGNVIGTIGTLFVCFAYYMNVTGKYKVDDLPYLSSNLFGAVLLLGSLFINFNLGSFIIELFWISISVIGLYHYFNKETKEA